MDKNELDNKLNQLKQQKILRPEVLDKSISMVGKSLLVGFIILNILALVFGLYRGRQQGINNNKRNDITSVIAMLDQYYDASATSNVDKSYPIAECTSELNSYDYDVSLKQALASVVTTDQMPFDELGNYSKNNPRTDCETVDTNYCQLDLKNNKNCYVYTSSISGDEYTIGYWNLLKGKFRYCTKFRTDPLDCKLF